MMTRGCCHTLFERQKIMKNRERITLLYEPLTTAQPSHNPNNIHQFPISLGPESISGNGVCVCM